MKLVQNFPVKYTLIKWLHKISLPTKEIHRSFLLGAKEVIYKLPIDQTSGLSCDGKRSDIVHAMLLEKGIQCFYMYSVISLPSIVMANMHVCMYWGRPLTSLIEQTLFSLYS